jgi:hypothetical protein
LNHLSHAEKTPGLSADLAAAPLKAASVLQKIQFISAKPRLRRAPYSLSPKALALGPLAFGTEIKFNYAL